SRICGSTASTIDPLPARRYFGGSSAANARLTVFFEMPNRRAIALIGMPSARCNRRISAQSSTLITLHSDSGGGQISAVAWGSVFTCRRQAALLVIVDLGK